MQVAQAVRLLSVPAAVALGTALAVACSGGTSTSPDQEQAPLFATTKAALVDDLGDPGLGDKDCPGGYSLISAEFTTGVDIIHPNGFVCQKNGGGGGGKHK
jgi:hypothetical protein